MVRPFLYEELDGAKRLGLSIGGSMPDFVTSNLNPAFVVRDYQKEAFARFFHCYQNAFDGKELPLQFLFNMATGSGKTLVMAGLILYLYEKGYRNFLFFVNSTNIIGKTQDNFLNRGSAKYLFSKEIVIGGKRVEVRSVENFEDANKNDINICFTTIQKLHTDLRDEKENALTFEDFKDKKIVLISDEAHHIQAATRQGTLSAELEKPTWENTVYQVFKKNSGNLLLEFTATVDYSNKEIADKYRNKILYRYDLKQFRNDGFSKDPQILPSDTDKKGRILQAIIVSQYRQEVATKHSIYLKPVILFKAQKTIEQSRENKELFHAVINELSVSDLVEIRKKTNVPIILNAFRFFKDHDITDALLVRKLKDSFAENKCLSVNEDREKEEYQLLLNSLEDRNNQIRAIFAVEKLNEGWDVLNLFDIVRLYETRDAKDNKPGQTTIREAQLIGRGARYFPFIVSINQDKYKRKYDKDIDNELRILEELHYHCHPGDKSRYIDEIRTALIQEGLLDEHEIEVELKLKEQFKQSRFYKTGLVYGNEKVKRSYEGVKSIADFGVSKKNVSFDIHSGLGAEEGLLDKPASRRQAARSAKDVSLSDFDPHIVRNAIARSEFFTFENIKQFFPEVVSVTDFIGNENYLAGLSITFRGTENDLAGLDNAVKFTSVVHLLSELEKEMKANITEYQGTADFQPSKVHTVFMDKKIKVKKGSERADGDQSFLVDQDWYVYDSHYGTSEEREFLDLISRRIDELSKNFREIYLIRNERQLKIFDFKSGQGFEPDYLLFLIDKDGKGLTYQLFIEPKGRHLLEHDKWKDEFLVQIQERFKDKILEFEKGKKYKIFGVPFYNAEDENMFTEKLMQIVS